MHYSDIELNLATPLLGGLSPNQFMQRHWQKKPLLVRGAVTTGLPILSVQALFALAAQDDVESRLIKARSVKKQSESDGDTQSASTGLSAQSAWEMQHGPLKRLPSKRSKGWTALVQGVNLHDDRVADLMQRFRFVPDARLDDVMISYASEGAGVGPHYDRYDVFLLQASGRRRWRIGLQDDLTLVDGLPLKILKNFTPQEEYILEPGDMLYLPPMWAHEGVALETDCMTYSVGFRQPTRIELVQALLEGLIETELEAEEERLQGSETEEVSPLKLKTALLRSTYTDKSQGATPTPAKLPEALQTFAINAITEVLHKPKRLEQLLGEYLSTPKNTVWFSQAEDEDACKQALFGDDWQQLRLHRKAQLLYDAHSIYINGQAWLVGGKDASVLRDLADKRVLTRKVWQNCSEELRALMLDWLCAGWVVLDVALDSPQGV